MKVYILKDGFTEEMINDVLYDSVNTSFDEAFEEIEI